VSRYERAYGLALDMADELADRGWSEPQIRHEIMRIHTLPWVSADMIATDAVRKDNVRRARADATRAA